MAWYEAAKVPWSHQPLGNTAQRSTRLTARPTAICTLQRVGSLGFQYALLNLIAIRWMAGYKNNRTTKNQDNRYTSIASRVKISRCISALHPVKLSIIKESNNAMRCDLVCICISHLVVLLSPWRKETSVWRCDWPTVCWTSAVMRWRSATTSVNETRLFQSRN